MRAAEARRQRPLPQLPVEKSGVSLQETEPHARTRTSSLDASHASAPTAPRYASAPSSCGTVCASARVLGSLCCTLCSASAQEVQAHLDGARGDIGHQLLAVGDGVARALPGEESESSQERLHAPHAPWSRLRTTGFPQLCRSPLRRQPRPAPRAAWRTPCCCAQPAQPSWRPAPQTRTAPPRRHSCWQTHAGGERRLSAFVGGKTKMPCHNATFGEHGEMARGLTAPTLAERAVLPCDSATGRGTAWP